jgi:hypothetical protein
MRRRQRNDYPGRRKKLHPVQGMIGVQNRSRPSADHTTQLRRAVNKIPIADTLIRLRIVSREHRGEIRTATIAAKAARA